MKPRATCIGVALATFLVTAASALGQANHAHPASTRSATLRPSTIPGSNFQEVQRKQHLPRPDLSAAHSEDLTAILKQPEKILSYITDPATPYLQRRAAAVQGAALVPVEQMPKVLMLIEEYDAELMQHEWAMRQHPMSASIARPFPVPGVNHNRTIFGHPWTLPNEQSDFPLTWDEEAAAPWPWQAGQALGDLFRLMVPSPNDPGGGRRWIGVAMTMPCRTDAEAIRFAKATTIVRRIYTLPEIARWRQIAGNPALPGAAAEISGAVVNGAQGWDDPRSRPFAQLVLLAAMTNPGYRVRGDGAYTLPQLRVPFDMDDHRRLPVPATTVLAVAALALDPKAGDDWTRLYQFSFSVCETVDDPPFKPDRRMNPQSPEVQQRLKEFAAWFEKEKARLMKLAETEKPGLDQLRKESDEALAQVPAVKS